MSKSFDNAKELEYISFDSTNNKINFSVDISSNGAPVAASVYDANSSSNGAFSLPTGNTASRPSSPRVGYLRFNTTTGFAEVYTGATGWAIFGAVPPQISTVTPSSYDGTTGTTFVINGSNFTSDALVKIIAANGTEYAPSQTSFINSTQISVISGRAFTVAEGPLDFKIIQQSGTTTIVDAVSTGTTPTWNTASGTISTIFYPANTNYTQQVVAYDPDANSIITYSISSGTLPSGASLNSANGAITGPVADPASTSVTNTFDVTATDTGGNQATRTFNIIRKWQDGSNESQSATSANVIYNLSSTFRTAAASGIYWIRLPGQSAKQVYCMMDSRIDNGAWMLTFQKPGSSGSYRTFRQLWLKNASNINSTYTNDSVYYPALPDSINFNTLGFTKHMFHNQHPSWISAVGDYHWADLNQNTSWSSSSQLYNFYRLSNSTSGTVTLYSRSGVWGGATSLDDTFSWFTASNNSGLCGGPNVCGTTACPNAATNESCHTNGSYPLLIYVK